MRGHGGLGCKARRRRITDSLSGAFLMCALMRLPLKIATLPRLENFDLRWANALTLSTWIANLKAGRALCRSRGYSPALRAQLCEPCPRRLDSWMPGDPLSGSKVRETLDREIGTPGENRGKVIAHRDLQPTAAFRHRENRRNLRSRLWTADVQPILSTKSYRKHGVLRQVST